MKYFLFVPVFLLVSCGSNVAIDPTVDYYGALKATCQSLSSSERSACERSVDTMQAKDYKAALQDGSGNILCGLSLMPNTTKEAGSKTWCENDTRPL